MFRILQGQFKSFKTIKFKRNLKKELGFLFWILQGQFKYIKIIKFKGNLKKVIRIFVLDTSRIYLKNFKIKKLKINLKK